MQGIPTLIFCLAVLSAVLIAQGQPAHSYWLEMLETTEHDKVAQKKKEAVNGCKEEHESKNLYGKHKIKQNKVSLILHEQITDLEETLFSIHEYRVLSLWTWISRSR